SMADGLTEVLAARGIAARFRRTAPGLWVDAPDGEPAAKICAFGVHVQRRVSIHGFALNVATDLDAFRLIVPCGLPGAPVTSMQRLGVTPPSLETLAVEVARAFAWTFETSFERAPAASLGARDAGVEAGAHAIAP
ncbi:MAG TPA: hypothetical protein VMU50_09250, partial [Polyangia bacterium]|nr:hypothetical protein [Polyangia bacterium]